MIDVKAGLTILWQSFILIMTALILLAIVVSFVRDIFFGD